MAAFMSTGKVICHHEPIKTLSDISLFPDLFQSDYHTHVGVSDSTAGFFMQEIIEAVRPPILIILRDPGDVKKSLKNLGMNIDKKIDMLCEDFRDFKSHPDVLTVRYDKLDDIRTMSKIWFHLLPGVGFDEGRFEDFKKLHIEADVPSAIKYVEDNKFRCLYLMRDVIRRAKES